MKLLLTVKTELEDLEIKSIGLVSECGSPLLLDWKSASITRNQEGFEAELKDIRIYGKDATGEIGLFLGFKVANVSAVTGSKKPIAFHISKMQFFESKPSWELMSIDCYHTDDLQKDYVRRFNLRVFIRKWMQKYRYHIEEYFNVWDPEDDSGLYDIAYDLKSDIEKSKFNPYTKKDKKRASYGSEFDDWYDCFIESHILSILRSKAWNIANGGGAL